MKKIINILLIVLLILIISFKILSLFLKKDEDVNFKKITAENVCIALNYHRVREHTLWNQIVEKLTKTKELTTYSVYEEDFEDQITKLVEAGAYFATPDDLVRFSKDGKYPDKCVWLSFDDADKTLYDNAFPILKEKQIPFTVFVISGQVGNEDFNNIEMATWDELREMRDSGLATFGSHTHDMHYLEDDKAGFLYEDKFDEFQIDIRKSKQTIEKELEVPISSIAYPFGETSPKLTEIVKKEGFKSAYILSPNPIYSQDSVYYQNRYLISKNNFNSGVLPWLNK